jgi:hypothetical protein
MPPMHQQLLDPDTVREELQEAGFPAPQPPTAEGPLPPGGSQWSVPYFQQFAATMELMSRTHFWTYDDAMANSRLNALVMRNDYIIKPAIHARIVPVAMAEYQLTARDETNPKLVKEAEVIKVILDEIPKFQGLKFWLLEDRFFGRSGAQLTAKYDYSLGFKRTMINAWSPVHADSIVFKYDDQTPGIMVNTSQFTGQWEATPRGPCHFLYDPRELEMFLWSEFEPEATDFYQSQRTGAVHGLGYRGTLYWIWWLREKITQIFMDFMQKVGSGITIFFYEAGNPKSLAEVTAAAKTQTGNNVYLFPRNRDGQSAYAGPGIQRIEVSMSGAEMFFKIWDKLNSIMRFSILGEVATTEEVSSGLGSTVAEQHGITADMRTKYDAAGLDAVMQQLTNSIARWNFPGSPPPIYKTMIDKRNPEEFIAALQIAYSLGLPIDMGQVYEVLGLVRPKENAPTLSKLAPQQPSSVGAIPAGVPMSAPGGPAAQATDMPGQAPAPAIQPQDQNAQQQAAQGIPLNFGAYRMAKRDAQNRLVSDNDELRNNVVPTT